MRITYVLNQAVYATADDATTLCTSCNFHQSCFKQGTVKVIRRQQVIDSTASNVKQFSSRREEELGTARRCSHATAMLGVVAKQKRFQQLKNQVTLPQVNK